jgi:hypothetical protein
MRRGPQPGWARRSATIRASTCGRSGAGRWPVGSSGRPAHQDLQPRTGAAIHAPFAGQPRSGALRPPPWRRRQGPPAQPGSAAPPAPTPPARCRPLRSPAKAHSEEGWNPQINRRPSPTYRSHCRPGPEAASRNCQPAAGATAESIHRDLTVAGGSPPAGSAYVVRNDPETVIWEPVH